MSYDQRDCLARVGYSSRLTDAAEDFLIEVFGGAEVSPASNALHCAMHIVAGICWVQPADYQLEASGMLPSDDPPDLILFGHNDDDEGFEAEDEEDEDSDDIFAEQ